VACLFLGICPAGLEQGGAPQSAKRLPVAGFLARG